MTEDTTVEIQAQRLVLTPLQVGDAAEMAGVLSDPELYTFIGGKPPSVARLTARYRSQLAGPSRDDEVWHNWILRSVASGAAVGFVQATVAESGADLAWVVGVEWQGQGFAREAAAAMKEWLAANGTERFAAHVHPEHVASQQVAGAIGLHPTGEIDEDDEEIWSSDPQPT